MMPSFPMMGQLSCAIHIRRMKRIFSKTIKYSFNLSRQYKSILMDTKSWVITQLRSSLLDFPTIYKYMKEKKLSINFFKTFHSPLYTGMGWEFIYLIMLNILWMVSPLAWSQFIKNKIHTNSHNKFKIHLCLLRP